MMDSADGLCDPAGANHLGEGIKKYKELIAYVESQKQMEPQYKKTVLEKAQRKLKLAEQEESTLTNLTREYFRFLNDGGEKRNKQDLQQAYEKLGCDPQSPLV
jgi:hypothetical protein